MQQGMNAFFKKSSLLAAEYESVIVYLKHPVYTVCIYPVIRLRENR